MNLEDKGDRRLRRKLADPDHAQRVAEIRKGMREMDRSYAMNLAMIRKAAQLTQEDLATRLGKGQAAVSKLERQDDLLLSTLASYIHAAGAKRSWWSPWAATRFDTTWVSSQRRTPGAARTDKADAGRGDLGDGDVGCGEVDGVGRACPARLCDRRYRRGPVGRGRRGRPTAAASGHT